MGHLETTGHGVIGTDADGKIDFVHAAAAGQPEVVLPGPPVAPCPTPPPPRVTVTGSVLLVDDDTAVLGVVSRLLLMDGFKVIAVSSGAEAIARLQSESKFDVLLTDLVMPVVDGRQVIAVAQRLRPNLTVAAMSGYTQDEDTRHLLGMQGVPLLSKPFSCEDLQRFMAELVSKAATLPPQPGGD